jgi:hypothetical protein
MASLSSVNCNLTSDLDVKNACLAQHDSSTADRHEPLYFAEDSTLKISCRSTIHGRPGKSTQAYPRRYHHEHLPPNLGIPID